MDQGLPRPSADAAAGLGMLLQHGAIGARTGMLRLRGALESLARLHGCAVVGSARTTTSFFSPRTQREVAAYGQRVDLRDPEELLPP